MTGSNGLAGALKTVASGGTLEREHVQGLFEGVLDGADDPVLLGGFLAALAQRGEPADEVAGGAAALRARMTPCEHDADDASDTCGTGGDGRGTFNLSTAAAFVAITPSLHFTIIAWPVAVLIVIE